MKYTEQEAQTIFSQMLVQDEVSKCPIYCIFLSTGFFASPYKNKWGYVTCTNNGRILIAMQTVTGWRTGALDLRMAKKMKIKKNIAGQYVIEAAFPTDKKDYIFKIQAARKVLGMNLPNQAEYVDRFVSMLKVYE